MEACGGPRSPPPAAPKSKILVFPPPGVIQGQIDGISRALLGPGDYFGEAALVSHFPRMATLIAVTDARVLRLKSGALFAQPWFVQTVEPCRQAITVLPLVEHGLHPA